MNNLITLCILCLLLATVVVPTSAVSIQADEDTWTDATLTGCDTHGSETKLDVRNVFFGASIPMTAWLQFPLDSISVVNVAKLNLTAGCATQEDTNGITGNLHSVTRTGTNWHENTLTASPEACNNVPSSIGSAFSGTVSAAGLLIIDVTAAVQNALSSGRVSFRVDPPSIPPGQWIAGTYFCSSETANVNLRPKLVVD